MSAWEDQFKPLEKNCPFCGGKASYHNDTGFQDEGFWEWYGCSAKTDTKEEWNARIESPATIN